MSGTVLVTGASGFLGSRIAAELANMGLTAVGAYLSHAEKLPARSSGLNFVSIDLRDPTAVERLFEAYSSFDSVVHAAALLPDGKPDYQRRALLANVVAQANLLDAALRSGCRRYIYCSSISVYDGSDDLLEGRPLVPTSTYGLSKYLGEEVLRLGLLSDLRSASRTTGMSLRFAGIHGQGRSTGVVSTMLAAACAGEPIEVSEPDSTFRLCFIDDAVAAVISSLQSASPQNYSCYNVAGLECISLREVAERIKFLTGSKSPIICAPDGRRRERAMPIAAFQRAFDYQPRGLNAHIRSMIVST